MRKLEDDSTTDDITDRIDSREVQTAPVGSPIRDAAVDPRPGDFLPPVNAGKANPHGPEVVAPGIHASESKAVLPGEVGKPARQQKRETELAARTLAGDEPVPGVVADLADGPADTKTDADDPQAEVELSNGERVTGTIPHDERTQPPSEPDENQPAKNASADEWQAYAVSKGMASTDADNASRDDLVKRYTA